MVSDTIADLLTRIRNAQQRSHRAVRIPVSKMNLSVLEILKAEGFIEGFEQRPARVVRDAKGKERQSQFPEYEVGLKYGTTGRPGIAESRRVSKPGRRVYMRANSLPKVHCGLGLAIISTSQGVMSDREARKRKIGGEVIAEIL